MAYKSLEQFNVDGVLTNLLAIEEHSLGTGISIDNWCRKKHYYLGWGHHAAELQQLMSSKDPDMARRIARFREKWQKLMGRNASAGEIRELRNEFREIIEDPTLSQPKSKCGVCALDKRKLNETDFSEIDQIEQIEQTEITETIEPAIKKEITRKKQKKSNIGPLLVAGIVIVGGLILLANLNKE